MSNSNPLIQEQVSEMFLTLRINLDTIILQRMNLEKLNKKAARKSREFVAAESKLRHVEFVLQEVCSIMESNL